MVTARPEWLLIEIAYTKGNGRSGGASRDAEKATLSMDASNPGLSCASRVAVNRMPCEWGFILAVRYAVPLQARNVWKLRLSIHAFAVRYTAVISAPPVALTIGGSDNSAGAGIQADLKTFTAYGVYGLTAVTCVVAEVPGRVSVIQAMSLGMIREQIAMSLLTFPVRAIKTGMLHSGVVIEAVAEGCARARLPLVVDPVMVASSGTALLEADAVAIYERKLFPLATLVTPNLDEARVLLGAEQISDVRAMRAAGHELAARYGTAFLIKGGHLGGGDAVDLLCLSHGETFEYHAAFTRGVSTHGTGCTYSAAIAAGLAQGLPLPQAVGQAKRFISAAVEQSFRWDGGDRHVDALNHWPALATR